MPSTGGTSSSRVGRRWRPPSCGAGLVDEVVAYVAPALLGAGTSAVGDLGITTIDDALRLRITDVTTSAPVRRQRAPDHDLRPAAGESVETPLEGGN